MQMSGWKCHCNMEIQGALRFYIKMLTWSVPYNHFNWQLEFLGYKKISNSFYFASLSFHDIQYQTCTRYVLTFSCFLLICSSWLMNVCDEGNDSIQLIEAEEESVV